MRQLRNQKYEDFYRGVIPTLKNPGKAPGRSFPKPTLSPVPPVLSSPDQARLPHRLKNLRAGPDDSDNKGSIISCAHGDNSQIIANRRR